MVRRTGTYVQEAVEAAGSKRAQPLSIDTVYSQRGEAIVGDEGVFRSKRAEIDPLRRRELDQRGHEDADALLSKAGLDPRSQEQFYRLDNEGAYVVQFAEVPTVPEGGVGLVRPRDNLRNAGIVMNAGIVEAGDHEVEATLLVEDQFVLLAAGAAIAELVVVPSATRG